MEAAFLVLSVLRGRAQAGQTFGLFPFPHNKLLSLKMVSPKGYQKEGFLGDLSKELGVAASQK